MLKRKMPHGTLHLNIIICPVRHQEVIKKIQIPNFDSKYLKNN